MFDPTQKTLALDFARALVRGDYPAAHAMCSRRLQARLDTTALREQFERMIPLDWGQVDPIELEDSDEPRNGCWAVRNSRNALIRMQSIQLRSS